MFNPIKKIIKKTSKNLDDLKQKLSHKKKPPNLPLPYKPNLPPPKPLLPPTKMPSKKIPPPKPLLPPKKLPSLKLKTPKKASVKVSPKASVKVSPKASVKVSPKTSVKVSPKTSVKASPKTSVKVSPKASVKVSPKASVKVSPKASVKVSPKTSVKVTSTKVKSPKQKVKSPEKITESMLEKKDVKKLQRYTIMDPVNVWGSKIVNMTNEEYVSENVPKFAKVLDILKKQVFPASRKDIAAKALIFVKNKKDGVEALATYLTSVGKMNPIDGTDDTNQISKGNNLLIMGEVSEKSPLFKYSAHSQKKSKGMVSKFNELDNKIGDKYPVMIIHEKFLEGIDLVGVTHIILVQEPGTVGMFDQIVGRGVRNCSHKYLPSSLWKVKIISLVNVDEGATPDEVIIKHRENNTKIVETVLSKSQEYSLDCSVSQKRYDLKCK